MQVGALGTLAGSVVLITYGDDVPMAFSLLWLIIAGWLGYWWLHRFSYRAELTDTDCAGSPQRAAERGRSARYARSARSDGF